MAWEMGAKNKAGLERGRKALSNAGDPKDDCRSCGHARDAHSGKTCSQCYSGRKYSHTFTEKGQAPVSLGDLENADAPARGKCEWCSDPDAPKKKRSDGSIVYQCGSCAEKIPLSNDKPGLARGLALTAGVTDGGCGSRLNHCGHCGEEEPATGALKAGKDAIPSERIRHPQDTLPSAKEGQSPCPRSYSEEHVFMPSGEGKQQCDLCGKTRTKVEGTLGKWRENDLGGLGMVERENAACPHCQHEGSEHGETGVCGQCDCLGAARYENEQGVCRCGHSQANHQDNGQGSDTSCLQCFDAKKCAAYSERKNAAGGDPGKKWAAMDRAAREKALEAAGLYKGYWLQELDEIHTPHAKKLAEVLERENAAGWAEYKSPLSEHKGPWECDECGARLGTDADVRSHKLDTGHSSYKSRKNSAELDNAWKCLECGRKFKDAAAAERATFSDSGCPGCGGSDIDDVVENSYKVKALCDTCAAKAMKSGGRLQDSIPGAGIERCDECRGGGPLLMVELKNGVTKRAWVHLQDPAKPATGRISCPCGQAPESMYGDGKDVHCPCGRAYDSRGWILEGPELEQSLENSRTAGVSRGASRYGSPRANDAEGQWRSTWDGADLVRRAKWLRSAGYAGPTDQWCGKEWKNLPEDLKFELGKAALREPA